MMEAPAAAKTIKPFCNAVTVIGSPVDEDQTGSGIILPHTYEGKLEIKRGVIVHAGPCHCESWQELQPGTVIFYTKGIELGDVIVVDHDAIIAYEEAS